MCQNIEIVEPCVGSFGAARFVGEVVCGGGRDRSSYLGYGEDEEVSGWGYEHSVSVCRELHVTHVLYYWQIVV